MWWFFFSYRTKVGSQYSCSHLLKKYGDSYKSAYGESAFYLSEYGENNDGTNEYFVSNKGASKLGIDSKLNSKYEKGAEEKR